MQSSARNYGQPASLFTAGLLIASYAAHGRAATSTHSDIKAIGLFERY
jgi:hypothetical protein